VVREAHAIGGQAVDVGRFEFLLAEATYVAIAQVVAQDKHNVGPPRRGLRWRHRDNEQARGERQ
jgi:hypothetical protein